MIQRRLVWWPHVLRQLRELDRGIIGVGGDNNVSIPNSISDRPDFSGHCALFVVSSSNEVKQ